MLDADGLNAHAGSSGAHGAGHLDDLAARKAATVLTPHAGELARLLDTDTDQIARERLAHVRQAASARRRVVVLKGDDTLVADPAGMVAVSPGDSPALATAGTGDVLCGVDRRAARPGPGRRSPPQRPGCCCTLQAGRLAARAHGRRRGRDRDGRDRRASGCTDESRHEWRRRARHGAERAVAYVDPDAVAHNCARLLDALDGARLCAVVKADGYGHGAVECARAALRAGATLAGGRHGRRGEPSCATRASKRRS